MQKEPMIQIPASLMLDLCRYHLSEMQDDPQLQGRIRAGLYRKLDAIRKRTEYTTFFDEKHRRDAGVPPGKKEPLL